MNAIPVLNGRCHGRMSGLSATAVRGGVIARAKGRLNGKPPKLNAKAAPLREDHDSGQYAGSELAEVYGISRATVYRTIRRRGGASLCDHDR